MNCRKIFGENIPFNVQGVPNLVYQLENGPTQSCKLKIKLYRIIYRIRPIHKCEQTLTGYLD